MLLKLTTRKPLTVTASDLQAAVQKHRFGVLHVHNLRETMAKKDVQLGRECLIYEVCQPQQAKRVLDRNMGVSTLLPCRISLYEEHGETVLATIKPTELVKSFDEPGLEPVAREVEESLLNIMTDAALGA